MAIKMVNVCWAGCCFCCCCSVLLWPLIVAVVPGVARVEKGQELQEQWKTSHELWSKVAEKVHGQVA